MTGNWIKYSLSGTVVAHPEEERVDIQSWQVDRFTEATTTADFTGSYTVSGRVADRDRDAQPIYAKLTFQQQR